MALQSRQPLSVLLITAVLTGSLLAYEHFVPKAYIPIKGDVDTIGIGTTVYPNGEKVKAGDTITRAKAEEYFQHDLDKFKVGIMKCIKSPLYQNEFEAYLSLTYNIGSGAFCSSSIPYKLNNGYYKESCTTILSFNKMRDVSKPLVRNARTGKMQYQLKVIRGLDIRRKSEYKTCIGTTTTPNTSIVGGFKNV